MPLYTYKCPSCGHTFEAIVAINNNRTAKCPECDTLALKQLDKPVGFHLKGEGFYKPGMQ